MRSNLKSLNVRMDQNTEEENNLNMNNNEINLRIPTESKENSEIKINNNSKKDEFEGSKMGFVKKDKIPRSPINNNRENNLNN